MSLASVLAEWLADLARRRRDACGRSSLVDVDAFPDCTRNRAAVDCNYRDIGACQIQLDRGGCCDRPNHRCQGIAATFDLQPGHEVRGVIELWMVANMIIALLLGWAVGYERYFKGRAAGSQVYCLVCVTSCAVTLMAGYPDHWYWGRETEHIAVDPTKVVPAILTGIGFLGAGLIVRTGVNVRGLTTAASIWGAATIGILTGTGFLVAAIGLTALFVACTAVIPWLEHRLPARSPMFVTLRFRQGYRPQPEEVHRFLSARGLSIPPGSLSVTFDDDHFELQCVALGDLAMTPEAVGRIARELTDVPEVASYTVAPSSSA
jgi:putative Mg2+ transporter-C (MgtC) family protein